MCSLSNETEHVIVCAGHTEGNVKVLLKIGVKLMHFPHQYCGLCVFKDAWVKMGNFFSGYAKFHTLRWEK